MKRKPLIIGVAGGTASGKTTIANAGGEEKMTTNKFRNDNVHG
jgi:uridine kinase